MELVAADSALKSSLDESIMLGQRINSDPATNPLASLADYYDFIEALVTYNPRNIQTGKMDGENPI